MASNPQAPPGAPTPAIKGSVESPKKPSSLGQEEGVPRLVASGCLDALTEAIALLAEKERQGSLEAHAEYVESVIDLRDRLELYLLTAPPGDLFSPTGADISAASKAAELLETA